MKKAILLISAIAMATMTFAQATVYKATSYTFGDKDYDPIKWSETVYDLATPITIEKSTVVIYTPKGEERYVTIKQTGETDNSVTFSAVDWNGLKCSISMVRGETQDYIAVEYVSFLFIYSIVQL